MLMLVADQREHAQGKPWIGRRDNGCGAFFGDFVCLLAELLRCSGRLTIDDNVAANARYIRPVIVRDGSRVDIDLAMTKGVNYPKGLLAWADEIGSSVIAGRIESLYTRYQEARYRLSPLLREMAASGRTFFTRKDFH